MAQEFVTGEVVQLRSGGPLLTVGLDGGTSTAVIYYNAVTGLFEKFTTSTECLRIANTVPAVPQGVSQMRSGGPVNKF